MIDAKRKAFVFLTLAFILAVITGALILNEVRSIQADMVMVKVAVAKQDLPTYTLISPDIVDWVEIPYSENMSSFVTQEADLEDAIVIVNLSKGDLITRNILRSQMDLPDNHRVIWLNATNNVVMDQAVAEGDTVDIIITYQEGNSGLQTTTMFKNVSVVQRIDHEEGADEIKISMSQEDAERFIHFQHTAEHIRVLLVNQIQQTGSGQPSQKTKEQQPEDHDAEQTEEQEEQGSENEKVEDNEEEKKKEEEKDNHGTENDNKDKKKDNQTKEQHKKDDKKDGDKKE
ncbi:pilus assembly protein CpaB [Caldalkalibacillus uzonensis]|uniref:Pilus assembly protein CpaB n=1 Tax=Caldalkalibacillus uzonensis TaxID=353224 RepID=A0ABU0CN88_9BACI|nr:hypothetical protein [Caldalkalibacillus uzonensis]MDQ0337880.1 pilus assembly protein CpaB [Caldalkalibacillus uzonensis]